MISICSIVGFTLLRLLLAWVVVGVAVVEEEVDVDVLGGGVGGSGDGCAKRAALLDMCGRCVRKKKKEKKNKSDSIAYLWLTSLLPLVSLLLEEGVLVVVAEEEEDVDCGRGSCRNVIFACTW